jgi:hypothetical protein
VEAPHVPALPEQGPLALPPTEEPAVVHPPRQVMPVPVDRRSLGRPAFDWRAFASAIYLLVAGAVLLRLFTGLLSGAWPAPRGQYTKAGLAMLTYA